MIRHLVLLVLAGLLAADLPAEAPPIVFLTDLEGCHDRFRATLDLPAVRRALADGAVLVHGGDVPDRFAGEVALVDDLLRRAAAEPGRLVLVAGNRDVNKVRLVPELGRAALTAGPVAFRDDWSARRVAGETAVHRLRWILERTMGAPDAFELRRRDLGGVDDEAVLADYRREMAPDGPFAHLLQLSRLLVRVGRTLFLHGGLTPDNLGVVPGHRRRYGDLDTWMRRLHLWYLGQLAAWRRNAATWDGRPPRPAEDLIRYGERAGDGPVNPTSVAYNRCVDERDKVTLPAPTIIEWLRRQGVDRLVLGHTPSGSIPVVLRTPDDDFEVVVADTSRAPNGLAREPAVVLFDGGRQGRTRVIGTLELDGRRRVVDYTIELGRPTPVGKRRPDGAVVVCPLGPYLVTYDLGPGYRLDYRLVPGSGDGVD